MSDQLVCRLFVYGTLMPGRLRWPFLEPFAAGHRSAAARGLIFDSGRGWPVAVLEGPDVASGDEHDVVPGYVVDLDARRIDAALVILDDVEDTATDTLRRVVVTTTAGEHAWAYHFTQATTGLRRIDRWQAQSDR
ncbi:hypothetical protein BH24ACT5_BH24ACT5_12540 [soil metagenome]